MLYQHPSHDPEVVNNLKSGELACVTSFFPFFSPCSEPTRMSQRPQRNRGPNPQDRLAVAGEVAAVPTFSRKRVTLPTNTKEPRAQAIRRQ